MVKRLLDITKRVKSINLYKKLCLGNDIKNYDICSDNLLLSELEITEREMIK